MRMAVRRFRRVVGVVSLVVGLGGASGTVAAQSTDTRQAAPPAEPDYPPVLLGVMADAGLPDGANAALVLRPAPWMRLHAGGGTNTVSAGYRGGLTLLLPSGAGPSLSVEVGHYRDGTATGLVRSIVGGAGDLEPLFARLGYTYVNAQVGLELGHGPVQFFIHAGMSRITATLHNATAALEKARGPASDPSTTVIIREDPILRVWAPSVKLGLVAYLGGKP
jgi:hypothetical protein